MDEAWEIWGISFRLFKPGPYLLLSFLKVLLCSKPPFQHQFPSPCTRLLVTVIISFYFSDGIDQCIPAEECDHWKDWRAVRKQRKLLLQHRRNDFPPNPTPPRPCKTLNAARELVEEAAAAGQDAALLQPVHPSLREARPGQSGH